jgi:hypothetical protein
MATGEFKEDQIYNWTYTDEQRARENWDASLGKNPYLILPKIQLLTYQLPDRIRDIAIRGDQDGFSLNEFFKAEEVKESGSLIKKYVFKHQKEVQMWLNILRGQEKIVDETYQNVNIPLPYTDARFLSNLNHTFWFLPSVASCKAMAELLRERQNNFYGEYEILVCAGTEAGIGEKALEPVKKAIGNGLKTKSITLSCGKLTTGVSVPQWGGIFFLRDTTSPETYFQAGFRVQTPWYLAGLEGI